MSFYIKTNDNVKIKIGNHSETLHVTNGYATYDQFLDAGSELAESTSEYAQTYRGSHGVFDYNGRVKLRFRSLSVPTNPDNNIKSFSVGSEVLGLAFSEGDWIRNSSYNDYFSGIRGSYYINGNYIGSITSGNNLYKTTDTVAFAPPEYFIPLDRWTLDDDITTSSEKYNIFPNVQAENLPMIHVTVKEGEVPPNVTECCIWISRPVTVSPPSSDPELSGLRPAYYLVNQGFYTNPLILNWINSATIEPPEDPKDPPILPEDGDPDPTSDPIPLPSIDELNINTAITNKLVTVWNCTNARIQQLASTLFESDDFVNNMRKIHDSPIETILKIHKLPVQLEAEALNPMYIGNVPIGKNNVSSIQKQFQEVDCGTIYLKPFYGTALDYDETEVSIYLPFVGEQQLDAREVLGSELNLKYRVDVVTGNCSAIMMLDKWDNGTRTRCPIGIYSGNMSNELPLTQRAVDQASGMASMTSSLISTVGNLASGNIFGAISSAVTGASNVEKSTRVQKQKTGQCNAVMGYLGCLTPYITVKRPIRVNPENYSRYYGYPANYTVGLKNCKGYTVIDRMISDRPNHISERVWDSILEKLKEGVII